MSIISFEQKRLTLKVKKNFTNTNHFEENKEETSNSIESSDSDSAACSNGSTSKKIIYLSKVLKLKQNAHWESVKLRNGLVVKIHAIRKEAEDMLSSTGKEHEELRQEILDLASTFSDFLLYSESTTIELLNKYWQFKNSVEEKLTSVIDQSNLHFSVDR